MEKIYTTNLKTIDITYPLLTRNNNNNKKYRGIDYPRDKCKSRVMYRPGIYRGIEYLITKTN